MAHIKSGGVAKGNKNSAGKRLGVKLFGGQKAIPGNIIIRQRGTKIHPGTGVGTGNDHTLYALREGFVQFGQKMGKKVVNVI